MADKDTKKPVEDKDEKEKKKEEEKTRTAWMSAELKENLKDSLESFVAQSKKIYSTNDESFWTDYINWMERKGEGDTIETLKKLHGDHRYSTIKDIDLDLEKVIKWLIQTGQKEKLQSATDDALIKWYTTSLTRVVTTTKKEDGTPLFDQTLQDAFTAFANGFPATALENISSFHRKLQAFIKKYGLTEEQKEAFKKGTKITIDDIKNYLIQERELTPEQAKEIQTKGLIQKDTQLYRIVNDVMKSVVMPQGAIPARRDQQQKEKELKDAFVKIPGLDKMIYAYDLSEKNLIQADPSYKKMMNNPALSPTEKLQVQMAAIATLVGASDKQLWNFLREFSAKKFDLAAMHRDQQQWYLTHTKELWKKSKELDALRAVFAGMKIDKAWTEDMINQLFDLSSDSLVRKDPQGNTKKIALKKYINPTNYSWSSLGDLAAMPLPLIFEIDSTQFVNDQWKPDAKLLQQLGTHKTYDVFEWNGTKIIPGNTLRISDTRDPKRDLSAYKYARKSGDSTKDGDIRLYKLPGATGEFLAIPKAEQHHYTIEVEKETLHIPAEKIGTLAFAIAADKSADAMTEAEKKESEKERIDDIIDDKIKTEYKEDLQATEEEKRREKEAQAKNKLRDTDRENEASVNALTEEELIEMKKQAQKEQSVLRNDVKKLQRDIDRQQSKIEKLEADIAEEEQKTAPLKKKVDELKRQSEKAKTEKELLVAKQTALEEDLRHSENVQQHVTQAAQKKAQEKKILAQQPAAKTQEALEEALEAPSSHKEFVKEWKDLEWDISFDATKQDDEDYLKKYIESTELLLQLPDATSLYPGPSAAWIRGTIKSFNPKTHEIQLQWHGVEGTLAKHEGAVSHIAGASGLKELKKKFTKVYKIKKHTSVKDRGLDIKNAPLEMDKKYKEWIGYVKDQLDFHSMTKKDNDKEKIEYFGSYVDGKRTRYKVEFDGDKVHLTGPNKEGKEVRQSMHINGFMIFAAEKWLKWYSQADVDKANGADKDSSKAGKNIIDDSLNFAPQPPERSGTRTQRNFISLSMVMSSWKKIKDGVGNYFKEKQKKDEVKAEMMMLNSKRFNAMKKLPLIGDAFDDMGAGILNKMDRWLTEEINKFKDEPKANGGSDSAGPSNYIKAVLFDDPSEAKKFPRKAAGYYLYALENGGPYHRGMKDANGTGMWVKLILGESYQKQYLQYYEKLKLEAKADPLNEDKQLLLDKQELGFFQKVFKDLGEGDANKPLQNQLKGMFGSAFFTKTIGGAEYSMWYKSGKISEAYEGEKEKTFDQSFKDNFPGSFEQNRLDAVLGSLQALGEKVGSDGDRYKKWMMAMAYPLLSEQNITDMSPGFKRAYADLAHKNGLPWATFVGDARAKEKITELFDMMTEDLGDDMFSKRVFWKAGVGLPQWLNAKDDKSPNKQPFSDRWDKNGELLLKRLNNPGEMFAVKKKLQDKKDKGDQDAQNKFNALNAYIDDKINEKNDDRFGDEVKGDSKILQEHILNVGAWFVKSQMTAANKQKAFTGKAEKNATPLREALSTKLKNIDSGNVTPELYAFVMKAFFRMFDYRTDKAKKEFIETLRFSNGVEGSGWTNKDGSELMMLKVRGKFDQQTAGLNLPDPMADGLELFEKFFITHKNLLDKNVSLLLDATGKSAAANRYIAADLNNLKKQQAENAKQLQQRLFTNRGDLTDYFDDEQLYRD